MNNKGQAFSDYLLLASLIAICVIFYTKSQKIKWAYALNLNGYVYENEICRESLAEVIYENNKSPVAGAKILIANVTYPYLATGFLNEEDCEKNLTSEKIKSRLSDR